MYTAQTAALSTLMLVLTGCATPIEVALERVGPLGAGPSWTVEPADAFGGVYYVAPNGSRSYQPPNITIRRMRAQQVEPAP